MCVDRVFTCHLASRTSSGPSAETALAAAIRDLRVELRDLLEDSKSFTQRSSRRQELLSALDFEAMRSNGEEARWEAYLASLDALVSAGDVTAAQSRCLLELWRRAREQVPRLRRPAVDRTDEGQISLSWSFVDVKGVTLSVIIERDARVDWFYHNDADGYASGTEDEPDAELPEEAFRLLAAFPS
jgi:hypothetical protein